MHLAIDGNGEGDLAERVYRQLVNAILDGRLVHGQQLPSTRTMASQLHVSRNTVTVAYERLAAEGYTRSRVGSGTFVASPPAAGNTDRRARPGADIDIAPFWRTRSVLPLTLEGRPAYNFGPGVADESRFPWDVWRRIVSATFRDRLLEGYEYASPAGILPLRQAIARYVGISRSVVAAADDVLVTNGSQHAIDLTARVLLQPGDHVAMEDPGYFPVRTLLESHGAIVHGIPLDAHGLIVEQLPPKTKLVYVTPSHQFPMGMPMSLERRFQLLEWADRHNAVIIEDDYDSEFRFDERPLDPLQNIDLNGRVVYVATFSKSLLPSLRSGFMIAPRIMREPLLAARQMVDWHNDLSTQMALAEFIRAGHLARHVRGLLRTYSERREILARAIDTWLSPDIQRYPSMAGLHTTVLWRGATHDDELQLAARAAQHGILLRGLHYSFINNNSDHPSGFILGFGNIPTERIEPGIRALSNLLRM
jgi:GntR family transcriptional regulator/MocR family aminotransferase